MLIYPHNGDVKQFANCKRKTQRVFSDLMLVIGGYWIIVLYERWILHRWNWCLRKSPGGCTEGGLRQDWWVFLLGCREDQPWTPGRQGIYGGCGPVFRYFKPFFKDLKLPSMDGLESLVSLVLNMSNFVRYFAHWHLIFIIFLRSELITYLKYPLANMQTTIWKITIFQVIAVIAVIAVWNLGGFQHQQRAVKAAKTARCCWCGRPQQGGAVLPAGTGASPAVAATVRSSASSAWDALGQRRRCWGMLGGCFIVINRQIVTIIII